MELEPQDVLDRAQEAREEKAKSLLNAWVAVTIALLATFMGICKVKDDNIVQAMQQAQANKIDYWGYYQAKNTQQKLFEQSAIQAKLIGAMAQGSAKIEAFKQAAFAESEGKRMAAEKLEQKDKAEQADKDYDAMNFHDDQFDLSDAALSVAIALLALTSLTQKRWLFVVALAPTTFGVVMGLAGLLGWQVHPDALTKMLSWLVQLNLA